MRKMLLRLPRSTVCRALGLSRCHRPVSRQSTGHYGDANTNELETCPLLSTNVFVVPAVQPQLRRRIPPVEQPAKKRMHHTQELSRDCSRASTARPVKAIYAKDRCQLLSYRNCSTPGRGERRTPGGVLEPPSHHRAEKLHHDGR